MADVVNLRLSVDGEMLAYCIMKQALEEIVALRDAKPWDFDPDKVADIARDALECEERLGNGA